MRAPTRGRSTEQLTKSRGALEEQRQVWEDWRAKLAAAQAEVEALELVDGDQLLDNPVLAETLPADLQAARNRVIVTRQALEAQRARVAAAEVAFLVEEAQKFEAPVAQAKRTLAEHEKQTAKLLAELKRHEGDFVPAIDHVRLRRDSGYRDGIDAEAPKSWALREAVTAAERPLLVMRELAARRDPTPMVRDWGGDPADYYPDAVWGPDAVVPAPEYRKMTQDQQAELEWLRNEGIPDQRALVADLDLRLAEVAGLVLSPTDLDEAALIEWRERAVEIAAEREQRAAALEQQVGEGPGAAA